MKPKNEIKLIQKLVGIAGIVGAAILLDLPALAILSSQTEAAQSSSHPADVLIATGGGGNGGNGGNNGGNDNGGNDNGGNDNGGNDNGGNGGGDDGNSDGGGNQGGGNDNGGGSSASDNGDSGSAYENVYDVDDGPGGAERILPRYRDQERERDADIRNNRVEEDSTTDNEATERQRDLIRESQRQDDFSNPGTGTTPGSRPIQPGTNVTPRNPSSPGVTTPGTGGGSTYNTPDNGGTGAGGTGGGATGGGYGNGGVRALW